MKKNKRQKANLQNIKSAEKKGNALKSNNKKNFFLPAILSFIVFALNFYLTPGNAELLFLNINSFLVYIFNFLLSAIVFYLLFDKKYSLQVGKYSFFVLLILNIAFSFFHIARDARPGLINLYQQIDVFINLTIIPSVVLGIIALWINKDKLNEITDDLRIETDNRKSLFSKKEIPYTVSFFAIIIISVFTLFYRLDNFDLYSDEAQVTQGAAGYLHSGEFYQYNFATKQLSTKKHYNRARPHQWLIAQSYKIFGISTWSSRFPSVVFGLLLTILGYFIGQFFIRDKLAALLIAFSFVFSFEFLLLERWARMYAILIPVYLLASYMAFKFIEEKNRFISDKLKKNEFLSNYFDFNYLLLPIFLLLAVLIYFLHSPAMFLFVALYLYALFAFFFFKEKKYLSMIIGGLLLAIIGYNIIPNVQADSRIEFFTGKYADLYKQFFFGYPVNISFGIIITLISIGIFFLIKNKETKKRYLYLIINTVFGWFLFAYLIKYSASFRYMSFISPLVIILLLGTFIHIAKTLFKPVMQYVLISLIMVSVFVQFLFRYDDLYVRNFASPARPSVAWKIIVDNYKKGEIIYRHWGPSFYFQGIDTTAKFLEIGSRQGKPFNEIYDTLKKYPSGWLTWHSFHSWRMDPKLLDYTNLYFKKLHGRGIDDTNVEVFYYTDSMLVDTLRFLQERLIPAANLNLNIDLSIGFWVNFNETDTVSPILFLADGKDILQIHLDNNKNLTVNYGNEKVQAANFPIQSWHYLVFAQNIKNKTFKVYSDGKSIMQGTLNALNAPIVKMKINTGFHGQVDDISIYDFELKQDEIQFIMQNKNTSNKEVLWFNDKPLRTLYHWQRK